MLVSKVAMAAMMEETNVSNVTISCLKTDSPYMILSPKVAPRYSILAFVPPRKASKAPVAQAPGPLSLLTPPSTSLTLFPPSGLTTMRGMGAVPTGRYNVPSGGVGSHLCVTCNPFHESLAILQRPDHDRQPVREYCEEEGVCFFLCQFLATSKVDGIRLRTGE